AELQHDARDVGGILADQGILEVHYPRLQVGLGVFDLAEAIEALVGDDADNRMLAHDGAAQVGDLHVSYPSRVSSRCDPRSIRRPTGRSAARCRWRGAAGAARSPR